MVVKVYISRTSGDKEIKHRQQVVLQILDSKKIDYEAIDIAEDDNKMHKKFMQKNATCLGGTGVEPRPVHALPPQIFNDADYCGSFEQLETANENNELGKFLKLVDVDREIYTTTADCKIVENVV